MSITNTYNVKQGDVIMTGARKLCGLPKPERDITL